MVPIYQAGRLKGWWQELRGSGSPAQAAWASMSLGFQGLGVSGLGFLWFGVSGFRGSGFRGSGCRGLGFIEFYS